MISSSIKGIVGRLLFFISQLLTHIMLTNCLGSEGYGIYQLSIAIFLICSVVGLFAIPKVALKFIPAYIEDGRIDRVKGLLKVLTNL